MNTGHPSNTGHAGIVFHVGHTGHLSHAGYTAAVERGHVCHVCPLFMLYQ